MNRQELIQKLQALNFPKEDYWLVTGGAMVLYGIRDKTHDIDLGFSRKLADHLEAKGFPEERTADGRRKFLIASEIEVYEEWLFDCIENVEGIPVISCKGLIMMKESLGREKDFADIALIRDFLKRMDCV